MEVEIKKASDLMQKVVSIQVHSEEISKLKGEHYNLFSVIHRERDEVVVHNRIVKDFLNPKGAHGLGNIPLKKFIKLLEEKEGFEELKPDLKTIFYDVDIEQVKVLNEHNLGKINDKKKTGGYVDIALLSAKANLYIESKIDAGDQYEQVLRYANDTKKKPNVVCYLTLNGRKASDDSAKHLKADEDYIRLSYATDIVNWLESLKEDVSDQPILRESIKQYILLLKKITGQLTNHKMQEELLELMTADSKSFKAAKLIHENFDRVYESVYKQVYKKLEASIEESIEQNRDKRNDAGFIPVKSYDIDNKTFELGVWIELGNRMMFLCMIEKGKNRNAGINGGSKFDFVSSKLETLDLKPDSKSRNGWRMLGTFPYEFNFDQYLNADDTERDECVKSLEGKVKSLLSELKKL